MFRIKYQKEFLDLAADTDGELEANSPLFLIDNVMAEYTTPITIVYSDKNARLIGPLFFNPTIRKKLKIEVELYKGDTYRCAATLVIESAGIRRNARDSSIGGYVLTGISSFFSPIKEVLLEDMTSMPHWGKPFTTWDTRDGSDGYWQAFQDSWQGTMDFVVAPLRNDNINNDTENPTEWMNTIRRRLLGYQGGQPQYADVNDLENAQFRVYPMLKLSVALESIFEVAGWTLDASDIDATWLKLVVFSINKIWTFDQYNGLPEPGVGFTYNDLLPKNTKASSFILAICRRYGWAPVCDPNTRVCTLLQLKNADAGTVKDWTQFADPNIDSEFNDENKIYAFKNNFGGNDAVVDDKDISQLTQTLTVASKFDLPAPNSNYDRQAVFCYRENAWYGIDLDENNNRIWVPIKDNIFNDEPDGATASVETDCTTLAMTWAKYATKGGTDYYGLFPYCSQPNSNDAGIRTLFYHGMVNEVLENGSVGVTTYPYLSSCAEAPDSTVMNSWSNVFLHKDVAGVDDGIEQFWFAKWLSYMQYAEVKTQNFNLPLHELVQYRWKDIILVQNIPHLVISYIEKLSQKAFIQAKLKRLIPASLAGSVAAGIYVQVVWENVAPGNIWTPVVPNPITIEVDGDVVFYVWGEAAGTIPVSPIGLKVYWQTFIKKGSGDFEPSLGGVNELILNAQRTIYATGALHDYHDSNGVNTEIAYRLVAHTGYTIIP